MAPTPSTFVSPGVTSSLPSLESSFALLKSEKAFIVGPGHAPVPSKLVSKIVGGQFAELADLLSVNLRALEQEPQMFLDGTLVVSSSKRRQVEKKNFDLDRRLHYFSEGVVRCSCSLLAQPVQV